MQRSRPRSGLGQRRGKRPGRGGVAAAGGRAKGRTEPPSLPPRERLLLPERSAPGARAATGAPRADSLLPPRGGGGRRPGSLAPRRPEGCRPRSWGLDAGSLIAAGPPRGANEPPPAPPLPATLLGDPAAVAGPGLDLLLGPGYDRGFISRCFLPFGQMPFWPPRFGPRKEGREEGTTSLGHTWYGPQRRLQRPQLSPSLHPYQSRLTRISMRLGGFSRVSRLAQSRKHASRYKDRLARCPQNRRGRTSVCVSVGTGARVRRRPGRGRWRLRLAGAKPLCSLV